MLTAALHACLKRVSVVMFSPPSSTLAAATSQWFDVLVLAYPGCPGNSVETSVET